MIRDCPNCGETYKVSPRTAAMIDKGYLPSLGRCTWKITGHTIISDVAIPLTKVYHLPAKSN